MYTQTYCLIIIHDITKDISNFKVLILTLKDKIVDLLLIRNKTYWTKNRLSHKKYTS